jgi:hypothetical protein
MKKLLLTLTFLGLTSAYINAATTFTASVNIENPIVLTETTALSFGTVIAGEVGNTVITASSTLNTIVASGSGTLTGGTVGLISINGDASQTVNLTITGPLTLTSGTKTLNITWNIEKTTATLDANGVASVKVGGALTVPANASTGFYTGSYTVNATY